VNFRLQHLSGGAVAVDPADRGLLLGDGVFDTMVAPAGRPFARSAHIRRLLAATAAIGIPVSEPELVEAGSQIIAGLAGRDAIVRTSVTRGIAERGLWPSEPPRPTIVVSATPWSRALVGQPARLITASAPRNEGSPLSRIKSLCYLENVLAAREASNAGADDAIFVNSAGRIACSTIANVFVLAGRMLVTPPVADGCLDGIMRAVVMDEAANLGFAVKEAGLRPEDVAGADAAFLTNSVRLLRPVTSFDGVSIPHAPLLDALLDRLKTLHDLSGHA
jgi:branched-chain amino acid aminotransferase